jgi:hypothetical protein
MNWTLFTRSPRSPKNQAPAQRTRFRPSLDLLEDRTLLALAVFVVDPGSSSLALSGDVGGAAIQQQGPGSLVTTYEGQIDVDFDLDALTISFLNDGSSGAIADISGSWQPNINGGSGSAPANYGAQAQFLGTGRAAVRDLVANATANSLPLTPDGAGGYAFDSTQTLTILQGEADYAHPIGGSGRRDLSNLSAQNSASAGNLQDNGDGTFTLAVPIDLTLTTTISGVTAHLRVSGSVGGSGGYVNAAPGRPGGTMELAGIVTRAPNGSITGVVISTSDVSQLGDIGALRAQTGSGDGQVTQSQSPDESAALLATHRMAAPDQLLAMDTLAVEMIRPEA